MSEQKIVLSFCLSGRNDNYGFNFRYRFVQAMNFLAWSAKRAGVYDRIEVVFADWNSETPLAESIALSEDAAGLVRFIVTPPEIAGPLNPEFSPFSQSIAFNTAFRRARGKYIGLMPADVLITSHSLRSLVNILSGEYPVDFALDRAIFAIPRKNLPFPLEEHTCFTSPEAIETVLLSGNAYMLTENVARGMMGGYGAFFLNREKLFELHGADERIAGWGYNDIDLALRSSDTCQVVNLSGYGVWSYDFEASPRMVKQKKTRQTGVYEIRPGTAANSENWGLGNLELREMRVSRFSVQNAEKYSSPVPDHCSYREWIGYLLHRLPVTIPRISAAALAAAQLSKQLGVRQISLFGANDISIPALLSLYNSFPELNIHREIDGEEDLYGLWRYDTALAPLHYQGTVSYLPFYDFTGSETPDMIIYDGVEPDWEKLKEKLPAAKILIFSRCAVPAELSGTNRVDIFGITVVMPPEIGKAADPSDWKPMNGNWLFKLLHGLILRHEQMLKLMRLVSRIGILNWSRTFRSFFAIRKKG